MNIWIYTYIYIYFSRDVMVDMIVLIELLILHK